MQRWFVLVLALTLTIGIAGGGFAQGAPVTGDERTINTLEGDTLGLITVEDVQDPFEDYVDGSAPDDDMRYVLLRVAFDATGEEIFDAQPNAIMVRDSDGVLWRPTNVRRDDPSLPDLQSQPLSPGNRVSGAVIFEVPEEAELSHVVYRPESSRILTLADLVEATAGLPGVGDEVTYSRLDNEGAAATISVMDFEDPFEGQADGSEPEDGMRYVTVTVSIEATGTEVFEANPREILLRDTNGFLWAPVNINRGEDVSQPNLDPQPLAPGNRISGVLGYAVPEDTVVDRVLFFASNDQVFVLADVQGGSGGVNAEATPT
jgi:hypothetical protein